MLQFGVGMHVGLWGIAPYAHLAPEAKVPSSLIALTLARTSSGSFAVAQRNPAAESGLNWWRNLAPSALRPPPTEASPTAGASSAAAPEPTASTSACRRRSSS